MLAFYTTV